jgi:alkyl hydroperoxide reductase subunit AhpC
LQGAEFKSLKLTDYAGKYIVLFFYPLDFTFVCPTEIVAFADANKDFQESNCQLIGASIDSEFAHFEYTQKARKRGGLGQLDIPLVADITKTIARIYGALVTKGPNVGVTTR